MKPELRGTIVSWNARGRADALIRAIRQIRSPSHARELIVVGNGLSNDVPGALAFPVPPLTLRRSVVNFGSAGVTLQAAVAFDFTRMAPKVPFMSTGNLPVLPSSALRGPALAGDGTFRKHCSQ